MAQINAEFEWTPHPLYPQEPEFYRRVLHYLPSAVVVVAPTGEVVYANEAALRLGGWILDENIETNVMYYVHPDDLPPLTKAFIEIAASPGARVLGTGGPWAAIYFRIVASDGAVVPIELVGTGGVLDPVVGGILYEVRPARSRNLLTRVLDGLSKGASIHQLLSLVLEIISSPPLDLDAAIVQSTPDGSHIVAASSSPAMTEMMGSTAARAAQWPDAPDPVTVEIGSLPDALAEQFRSLGHRDVWTVTVESPLSPATLRIVACSNTHHVPDQGPIGRLIQARELAAAVLLRSQTDAVLSHVASHDGLTDLPNRLAFHDLVANLDPLRSRAALHLDLDGIKRVNSTHGFGAGDAVLQIVADRLRSICGEQGMIGRVGDDEFTVVVSHTTAETSLDQRALRLATEAQASISEPIIVAGRTINISASIGLAVATPEISLDHLLSWAESAMHQSKGNGGNQITVHNDSPS